MKLVWNKREACFEAEFQDFQSDLLAVKVAGFKTTGKPDWKWFTFKTSVLDKLKENRPASGLTILEDALNHYNRLKEEEKKKEELLKELKRAKKVVKKEEPYQLPEGRMFGYNEVKDTEPTVRIGYIPPKWEGAVCFICRCPVYFYEKLEPPTCMWCEIVLDNEPKMF